MKKTNRNTKTILLKDFIGKHIKITESTDPTLLSVEGTVLDETKNMLEILKNEKKENKHGKRVIRVPKENIIFKLYEKEKAYEIKGRDIVYAPEKRTKKLR